MGRLLPPCRSRPRLHAVRVPPGPGDRGRQAGRGERHPGRAARDRGRRRDLPVRSPERAERAVRSGDNDFHLCVATASHNRFLVAAVREARRLQRQTNIIGMSGATGGHASDAIEEHAAIYRAIRDGDPDEAARAAAVHLDNTLEDYRREIQRRLFGQ
ncbi:FCD domain-containing protein [Amycolatopsis sp. NBC_01307]|uniref:FadR/GntR family transcriptional regulator n=1 Tax=Amycolatopsis sp. NBC_01307 TaxID=2903561 RepID=UPI002E12FB14|nr:FCD domain-containing protein [Amycolatopsis sp. NBC_01307]